MTDLEYEEWLLDVERNPYRILLVELDHSTGTIYLASSPWLSDGNVAYDDWMVGTPEMQDSLENFLGVGDVDAINPDPSVNWLDYSWRGYPCRWFYGDEEWLKVDFRPIASTLIDNCRVVNGKTFRFDLMDTGQHLQQTFLTTDVLKEISAKSTINFIMSEAGLPPVTYINVPQASRDFKVSVAMTPESKVDETVKEITDSLGAYIRANQSGGIDVFVPEFTATPLVLTEDDIQYGQIRMVDRVPAYKTVTIIYADGTTLSGDTTASTGELNEELRIQTVINAAVTDGPIDAGILLAEKLVYHSTVHDVWQIPVLDVADLIQVGDDVSIIHDELTGVGIVGEIKRAPLSPFTNIEVTI